MSTSELIADLSRLAPVLEHEPIGPHTTFGIGGPADVFVIARSAAMLAGLVQTCMRHKAPLFLLGNGSNILVSDLGFRGVVIENRARKVGAPQTFDGKVEIEVESGISCAALARRLARQGIAGFEWAAGIPGTIGGACFTNAGAYGGQLSDYFVSASIVDPSATVRTATASEMDLRYRKSALSGVLRGAVVLSVRLRFSAGEPLDLMAYLVELESRRKATQPTNRNVGSMFKNTGEHPAWWYIDQLGLRGHRIGDVEVSRKHTNFFINRGNARSADVMALIEMIRSLARERWGIEMETEVIPVGEGFA
jgi:UDP-N-acetylmuramate dehydrogenase